MSAIAVVEVGNPGAASLATALSRAGNDATLVGLDGGGGAFAGVERAVAPPLEVRVTPGTLAVSYQLYRYLATEQFDAIVFGDAGAHGYCAGRAKELGLAFTDTTLVTHAHGPFQWVAERECRSRLDLDEVRRAVAERLQLELSDALVAEPALAGWMRRQGWELPERICSDDPGSWSDALAPAPRRAARPASEPSATVVVAHHERPHLLPFCLESLARQTYPRLEVVVVDSGSSTPEAVRVLDDLEARSWPWPLRVLRLPSGSVDEARNAGWRAATTDLVLFFDDDDVAFDELVAALVRGRDFAGVDVVTVGGRPFHGDGAPEGRPGDVVGLFLARPYEFGLLRNQYGSVVSLYPRTLLEQLGGFSHAEVVQEDGLLLARATLAGASVSAVPDPLFWHRQTPGGRYRVGREALLDAWPGVVAELHAEHLPSGYKLLPRLAGGAYVSPDGSATSAGSAVERPRRAWLRLRRLVRRR